MQTAANYHIYMEMEGARMIQKEKIRGVGYFLMALAAGLLPFAAPDACAKALREIPHTADSQNVPHPEPW